MNAKKRNDGRYPFYPIECMYCRHIEECIKNRETCKKVENDSKGEKEDD